MQHNLEDVDSLQIISSDDTNINRWDLNPKVD